ncbi:MAG: GNAT family N-acetyltransferase [Flavobacteriales bacterium]|nr:GNAT family N-acetyltransferase [Flavobacteriales bacterium]
MESKIYNLDIIKATLSDLAQLQTLAAKTFIQSHGHSAAEEDIEHYVSNAFSMDSLSADLQDQSNYYHLLKHEDLIIGYSNIQPGHRFPSLGLRHTCMLKRIYLQEEFLGQGFGKRLLDFNIELSKVLGQEGMCLYVWTENIRAVEFYRNQGFRIIGSYDFPISPNHSNPNHRMLLRF